MNRQNVLSSRCIVQMIGPSLWNSGAAYPGEPQDARPKIGTTPLLHPRTLKDSKILKIPIILLP